MVIKERYKQTEIGIIPKDWEVKNILDNFTIKARIGWQGLTTAEYLKTGDYGLVTGTDFKNGYIDWDNCVYVERERFVQDKNIQLKIYDVLVTKDGTIGKVAFVDKLPNPTTLNSGVFVLRPKNESINNRFFYCILMSFYFDNFLTKITAGSTITHLYQKDFVNFNFILPSLTEQTAIATALSDTDGLITSLEKLIAKKRNIKQGAMQQLLQPKESWEVKKIEEIADVKSGKRLPLGKTLVNEQTPHPYLRILDMDNGGISLNDIKYVPLDVFPSIKNYRIYKDDIYISVAGTLGLVGRIPVFLDGANLTENANRLTNIKCDISYLLFVLKSDLIQNKIEAERTLGAQPKLALIRIRNFEIPFPPKEEQTRIATILSDMDAELSVLERKLEKYKKVKLGMMQELLTGKTRLV
jgi:type I restriction enzyme S subunit